MKRFNISEFIWFFILLMFTVYIYLLLSTGKITMFLHPKMVKYTAFSFVVFGELTICQLFNVFTVKTRVRFRKGYILFFITLIIGIFIAPGGLNSDIGSKKGVILVSSSHIENIGKHVHTEQEKIEGDVISFNNENYIHYLEDLSNNLDKHIGKKIKITGFALKQQELPQNEFIVTRMLINCCAADSQIFGITVKYDKAGQINKDDWVSIEGTLEEEEVKDKNNNIIRKYPIISVQKLREVQKPENPYIYE